MCANIKQKYMKTAAKIFFIAAFSMLLLAVSCSKKQPEQKESDNKTCCSETEAETKCCSADENALMIVATLTVMNETDVAEMVKALHQVVDGTRTEEGNISYVLHQDINNPMTYIIIEVWKSQEAIDYHNQTPHFLAFVEAVKDKTILSVNTMKKVY